MERMIPMDFKKIDRVFDGAAQDNRPFLFEHEVYALLAAAGIKTPQWRFIPAGRRVTRKDLAGFSLGGLVLKVVSPLVQHKTDVGGVAFVAGNATAVNTAIDKILRDLPGRFLAWSKTQNPQASSEAAIPADIRKSIRGVLLCEKVDFDMIGFGTELLIGVRNSREFGPIVTAGAGGVEVEYWNERFKAGQAVSIVSAPLVKKEDIMPRLKPLAVYAKLVKPFRGRPAVLKEAALAETVYRLARLAAHYSPFGRSPYVIEELEVNPFVVRSGSLVPLDGLCRFSRERVHIGDRPVSNISFLLHPASIAIIGVSERMNMGHIILNNILNRGFPRERVFVVKPGMERMAGCVCVPDVASLPEAVDLFVLTLAAEQSCDVMAELIAREKARSVILIAGGLGEKKGTRGLEEKIVELIAASRGRGRLTPVVNGGNCLGIYSKPGRYDTTFIPEYKLRFPKTERSDMAYISQSGAFMVSRVSKFQRIEPLYAVSLGNQIDLRLSDYLRYLKDDDEVKIFAVYVEGFKPGDGYLLAEAARKILAAPDRHIVVYKSGRTPEGRLATSSHTASVAGDYSVCKSILEGAGCIVAESLFEFDSFVKSLSSLVAKNVNGNRVGLLSNAGFESVIMADSIGDGERLELAPLSDGTKRKLAAALGPLGIDKLQDIKNPLDITPVADDAVFCACARALIEDPHVDCAVISPVPMTPAMQTLAPGPGYAESIFSPESTSSRLIGLFREMNKPFVVNIDAGASYDPMASQLEDAGIPVFRRVDEAVQFLRKFVAVARRRKTRKG